LFHLIEVADAPVGFLRLDFRHETEAYEVSVVVAQVFQGRGIASAVLAMIRRMLPWAKLHAWVNSENAASVSLFRKMGYEAGVEQGPAGRWYASVPLSHARRHQPALQGGVSS
jgi:GNAT superfamily N-acetyltransferase